MAAWTVLQSQWALVLASLGQIASLIGLRGFAPIAAEQILSQTKQNGKPRQTQFPLLRRHSKMIFSEESLCDVCV